MCSRDNMLLRNELMNGKRYIISVGLKLTNFCCNCFLEITALVKCIGFNFHPERGAHSERGARSGLTFFKIRSAERGADRPISIRSAERKKFGRSAPTSISYSSYQT